MKNIIIIAAILLGCNPHKKRGCELKYQVEITDINSSRAHYMVYHIGHDSITIKSVNSLVKGNSKVVSQQHLTKAEQEAFCNYLTLLDLDTFKNSYINPLVEDGDQKSLRIELGEKSRTIFLSNFYLKDLDDFFDLINSAISQDKYKIKYRSPEANK